MSDAIAFLPLALLAFFYCAVVKLAAFLFRRTQLRWPHAFVYGLSVIVVGVLGALLNRSFGFSLPLPVAFVCGLGLQLSLGGWYFGSRATTSFGSSLHFKGGVMLSLIAYGIIVALGIAFAIILPALLGPARLTN
jgi:hypothetical protein